MSRHNMTPTTGGPSILGANLLKSKSIDVQSSPRFSQGFRKSHNIISQFDGLIYS